MRILHLNEHLASRGGVETYLLSLLPRLEQAGHEPAVAFSDGDAALATIPFATPNLGLADRGSRLKAYTAMRSVLSKFNPDIVHVHNVQNTGAIEACLDTTPTVVSGHDYRYLCPASDFFHRRTESICKRTCGPACFVVTLGRRCMSLRPRYAHNYYKRVRWFIRNRDRFSQVIVPSGAAAARFFAAGFARQHVTILPYFCPIAPKERPRDTPDRSLITFIGRLSVNKGVRFFVEALGRLPEEVHGLVVGNFDDAKRDSLKTMAQAARCAARIESRPWATRKGIEQILGQTSVLVFPSIWPETLGIVGLEAMATGVPVVASDVGGVSEWLHDGRTGFLVPPKDASALAAAIQQILASRQLAERMGRAGCDLIRERFSPQSHVTQIVQVYEQARTEASTHENPIGCYAGVDVAQGEGSYGQ